jgi:hypothetical protein
VLWIFPQLLSGRWRGESELPEIGSFASRKAMEGFNDWLRGEKPEGITGSARRACVFNLSSRLRAFDKALTAASMPEPPRPPSASGEQPSQRRRSQRG